MGDEADADWQAGLVEMGIENARSAYREPRACKGHKWSAWKVIGRTGDWLPRLDCRISTRPRARTAGATLVEAIRARPRGAMGRISAAQSTLAIKNC